MKQLNPTLILCEAGESYQVSPNFNSKEFEDGFADYVLIDMRLVDKLEKLRFKLGKPLKITSGFRSTEKQADLKRRGYHTAKGISTHQVGSAADITTFDGSLTGEQIEEAARQVGFKAVGVGNNWCHVDLRADKIRRWTY